MANSFVANRAQLAYALCLPLAVLIGYFLADPTDFGSVMLVVLVVGVMSIPVMMRWYHALLLVTWNAAITPFFFPGQPFLWMIVAVVGLGFALLNRFTSFEARFTNVPGITRSLLFLTAVVLITAWLRGGIGSRIFGSSQYGGRSYFYVLAAIIGYFTLTSQRIPKERANLVVSLFFLSGLTAIIPNLAFLAGSAFSFVFYFVPSLYAQEQATAEYSLNIYFGRMVGLNFASIAFYCWLLSRYGLRGLFDSKKPWRALLFIAASVACLYTGFRGSIILFTMTLAAMFYLEGLCRTRVVVWGLGILLVVCAVVFPNADRLPLVVQRTLSFLPVPIDPIVKQNAEGSSEWRLRMWQEVIPQVPQYLLKGKGYTIDSTDLQFASFDSRRGQDFSGALTAEDFHNGALTLLIPFGIWGFGGFLVFLVITCRYMYRNYRYGDPALKTVNACILAFFAARALFFFAVFGSFMAEFFIFTGLAGLSVSLNGVGEFETSADSAQAEEDAHEEAFAALQHHSESK